MSILYTLISKEPKNIIYEYTEYEGDVQKISSLILQDIQKNKKIYRKIGEYLGCYTNRNNITYFCISDDLNHEVIFSFLDDLEGKFLKEYKQMIENNSIINIDKSKDQKLENIIKELIDFYQKNPTFNKFGKILDTLNRSLETIKENEKKLLERDQELEIIFQKAQSINNSSQIMHFKAKRVKIQERKRRTMCMILCGSTLLIMLMGVLFFFFYNEK